MLEVQKRQTTTTQQNNKQFDVNSHESIYAERETYYSGNKISCSSTKVAYQWQKKNQTSKVKLENKKNRTSTKKLGICKNRRLGSKEKTISGLL